MPAELDDLNDALNQLAASDAPGPELEPAEVFKAAVKAFDAGDHDEAERLATDLVGKVPTHARAWQMRGLNASKTGQHAKALEYVERAVGLRPGAAMTHHAHGKVLAAAERFGEACDAYQRAASLMPGEAQHIVSAAGASSKTDDHERTAALYRRAVKLAPDNAMLAYTFARCLRRAEKVSGRVAESLDSLDSLGTKVCWGKGGGGVKGATDRCMGRLHHPTLHSVTNRHPPNATQLLFTCMQLDESVEQYRAVLVIEPGHEAATFWLAVVRNQRGDAIEIPSVVPDSIVMGLYEGYADHFDDHLTKSLKYKTPDLLRAMLLALEPTSGPGSAGARDGSCSSGGDVSGVGGDGGARWLRCLDLGCGTGLSGVVLRSLSGFLEGVDLSPAMVEKARERDIYDHLSDGECPDTMPVPVPVPMPVPVPVPVPVPMPMRREDLACT